MHRNVFEYGQMQTPCSNHSCLVKIELSDQFCSYCGTKNPQFRLPRFNLFLLAEGVAPYGTAEEAQKHCVVVGGDHFCFEEHSNEMYRIAPEEGRKLYCPICGVKVIEG